MYKFESSATVWAATMKTACDVYIAQVSSNHTEFSVSSSGLVKHTSYLYLAATLDGIIRCECCGLSVLEIKCPFSCVSKTILQVAGDSKFRLTDEDEKFTLNKNNAYYYQIQTQIKLCGAAYGDFVVWRENELIVHRIYPDETFVNAVLEKATEFFQFGVLPELLEKWYSKSHLYSADDSVETLPVSNDDFDLHPASQEQWCFCRTEEAGKMIACDNKSRPIG